MFKGDSEIYKSIRNNIDYVKSETLANEIQFDCEGEKGLEVLLDKLKTNIFITKV